MTDLKELMVRLDKVENQSFYFHYQAKQGAARPSPAHRTFAAPLFAIYCVNFLPAR